MTDRLQGVSGSEVAALFGMSPYLTKVGLYMKKKGLVPDKPPTMRMKMGRKLEPVVVDLFEEQTGMEVDWRDQLIEHPKERLIIGTPDGLVGDSAVFEAKTAGLDRAHEWGDEQTDQIPRQYLFQVQHYLLLTGRPKAHLAALIGGSDFRTFEINEDKELQALMLEEVRRFFKDYVDADTPPELDYSEEAKEFVLSKYPSATDGVRDSTESEDELVIGILQTKKERAFLEQREEALKNQLKASIGFSRGITSRHGRVTWTDIPATVVQSFERKASRRLNIVGKREVQ